VECAGSGPSLVVVHGGTGDLIGGNPLPLFESRFTICAMDRRGTERAVMPRLRFAERSRRCRGRRQFATGQGVFAGPLYGAVCALEAAFLTHRISK